MRIPRLGHVNIMVRNSAAIGCLNVMSEQALPALETISAGRDKSEAVSAWWAPERWHKEQSNWGRFDLGGKPDSVAVAIRGQQSHSIPRRLALFRPMKVRLRAFTKP